MTGHELYHRLEQSISVYEYDSADNGPECEIITRILAKHPFYRPGVEKRAVRASRLLDRTSLLVNGRPFDSLTPTGQNIIRARVARAYAALGLA